MIRNIVAWVREQLSSFVTQLEAVDERLDDLEALDPSGFDDRIDALEVGTLRHTHSATDTAVEIYVDATSGSDSAAGTQLAPLQTIGEVYRRFHWQAVGLTRVLVHLVGNGSTQVTYTTPGLWVGGGFMADQNTFAFRGPAMIAWTPATGPSTAALDVTPCERVAQDQSTDVSGPRTKLSFATAAPGWTTNDLAGSFLQITRGGVPLTFEVPITENTADAIFVDHVGLVGQLLSTDTVRIVRPAVKIDAAADAFSSQPLLTISGNGGARRVYDGTYVSSALRTRYSTFERIEFGCVMAEGTGALCFDRCLLANASNRGHEFRGFSVGFANTASHTNTLIYSGISTYAVRRVDQETLVTSAYCTDLQVAPPASAGSSGFRIGGSINDNGMAGVACYTAQAPLSVYRASGTGVMVCGPGSQLQMRQSVGRILGRGNSGFGLAVLWGAIARVRSASNFVTGTLGDVKVNVGAPIAWGSASGAFEDAATWNGDFCRLYDFYKDSDQSRVTTRVTTNTSSSAGADNTAGRAPKLDDLATPDDNTDLNATTTRHGLLRKLSGSADEFLNGEGDWVEVDVPVPATSLITETAFGLPYFIGVENGEFANATHSHGTPDLPKLDELDAPTDVTTLNASTSAHGLMPKGVNDSTKFYRSDLTQAVPVHNSLSGLTTGDPHTQYALVDGTRAFTGTVTVPNLAVTPAAASSGTPAAGTVVTGAAHTGLSIAEASDVSWALARTVTFGSGGGTLALQRAAKITAPTYAAAAALTISDTSTLDISGQPVAGSNVTLTRPWALSVGRDTNCPVVFGRAVLHSPVNDIAYFCHYDRMASDQYALYQNAAGETHLNAVSGQICVVAVGDSGKVIVDASNVGCVVPLKYTAAGSFQTTVGAAGGASALPATPTKYGKFVDNSGTTFVFPLYAAS